MAWRKKLFLSLSVLAMQERGGLPNGSHLEEFIVRMVKVLVLALVVHHLLWITTRMGSTFSPVDHAVESLTVRGSAATKPDGDAPGIHRLNCCGVKGRLQRCRALTFPQPSEVIQALPCLLHWAGDVGGPDLLRGVSWHLCLSLLKFTTISLVLDMFKSRLFHRHHDHSAPGSSR